VESQCLAIVLFITSANRGENKFQQRTGRRGAWSGVEINPPGTSQHLLFAESIQEASRYIPVVFHLETQEAGRGRSCWASPSPLYGPIL